jgi:Zn-dependent peptidase ImmA (M78 family)
MRREKRSVRKEFTPREIARFTRLIRKLLGIHDRKAINLLVVFEQLRKLFPKLKIRIVPDADLEGAEARAYPSSWLIKIRRGVYEGLLRGDVGSRWTFAHELGHVLLQHPGQPFRKRMSANDDLAEQQAHIFAAEFLAPSDIARNCKSPKEIGDVFRLSNKAAGRRFSEIALDDRSKSFGTKKNSQTNAVDDVRMEDCAAIICTAILTTISENAVPSILSLEPFKNNLFSTSTLSAKASALLCDAYESVRGIASSDRFTVAASLAAAILATKPIRDVGSENANHTEILRLNQLCALRAGAAYLKIEFKDLERILSSETNDTTAISFTSDYLEEILKRGDKAIITSSIVLHFRELPTYYDYNERNEISWSEIHQLESIAQIFALLSSCRRAI